MDLFLAICQGLGLALAAGIGGMLAVLLMSVLAHVDVGWDLEGTDVDWFATEWFIPILFVLNVGVYLLARGNALSEEARRGVLIGLAAAFGAIAFGGSLAEETSTWWPGLAAGAAVGAAAASVTWSVLNGAIARSEETAGTLQLIAAGTGLVLVLLALFVPPVSILVAIGLAVLGAGRRRRADEKYEGLRSLR
jgi:phosphatidylserine synthase